MLVKVEPHAAPEREIDAVPAEAPAAEDVATGAAADDGVGDDPRDLAGDPFADPGYDFTPPPGYESSAPGEGRALSDDNAPPLAGDRDEPVAERAGEIGFQALAEAAPDAIVCGDAYGRITYWNRAAEQNFGWTADEALGEPLTLIIPERFRRLHEDGLERYLATGKTKIIGRPVELAGLRKDGGEFPLELSIGTWTSHGDVHFTAILRDIGDRRKDELALSALGAIVESSDDAIIGLSVEGEVTS
jgi:PAS domain S-box-containing protein